MTAATNSGNDVPTAIRVKPIMRSEIPMVLAISLAPITSNSAPKASVIAEAKPMRAEILNDQFSVTS